MRIGKIFSRLLTCVMGIFLFCSVSVAATNLPSGEVGDYGNWFNQNNVQQFNSTITSDFQKFEPKLNIDAKTFVPIEAKIGLMFMKALSGIDYILQVSLVRFIIIFLLIMYAIWIGLSAYKTIKDSTDYKTVFYDIFKQGIILAIWILVLNYGPAKIFVAVVSPILSLGTYLSDFILNTVANTHKINIPDTCAAIHNYVNNDSGAGKLLFDADTAANIMCLPSRISVFFYHAVGTGFRWAAHGFGHSVTMIIVGIVSVVMFIGCIFKFAFMTLGVIADLFLTLLLLPFTAVAESLNKAPDGESIPGRIYNGFLSLFVKTQKTSDVLGVFINAALYFVFLSIIIAICAALLSNIISLSSMNEYTVGSAVTTILSGCLVFYLAGQTDKMIENITGNKNLIDNSFGKQLTADAKTLWGDFKKIATGIVKKKITK